LGRLNFQRCSDAVREAPQTIRFEVPLTLEPFMVAQGITVASRSCLLNPFTDAFFLFGYESVAVP
jgi:hypothetical protein